LEPEPLRVRAWALTHRSPEDERQHYDQHDHGGAEDQKRTALARPRSRLGRVRVDGRRGLTGNVVLALEDERLVLDRSLVPFDGDSIPAS
jgi:hypothetical protein